MSKHFLRIPDLEKHQAYELVRRALEMKNQDLRSDILAGKTLVLIFEKASTRTRISFETAIRHLGGETIFMTPNESQLGRSEPLKDTARVLSRYVQGMVVRTFGQNKVDELARYGSIPVINGLTDMYHPCQVMSDILTIYERDKSLEKLRIAWVGDGNNMAHSWINAAVYFGFDLHVAVPRGYEPEPALVDDARKAGARITLTHDPFQAVDGADYINTDVWASMGQEEEQRQRMEVFKPFQVNEKLVARAGSEVRIMHCLPAHRGEEITEGVLEGDRSIVWDQAENRLHMQKAILEWIYS